MKKLLTFLILLSLFSCTNKSGAEKALRDSGFHPISIGGRGWFKCQEGEIFATKFEAFSPDSTRVVKGCVCQGLLKGKTIRLD